MESCLLVPELEHLAAPVPLELMVVLVDNQVLVVHQAVVAVAALVLLFILTTFFLPLLVAVEAAVEAA